MISLPSHYNDLHFANCLSCISTTLFSFKPIALLNSLTFMWVYFLLTDQGNAHLAVFTCVISKIVGATYYQQSACFLPYLLSILLKQQVNCLL